MTTYTWRDLHQMYLQKLTSKIVPAELTCTVIQSLLLAPLPKKQAHAHIPAKCMSTKKIEKTNIQILWPPWCYLLTISGTAMLT